MSNIIKDVVGTDAKERALVLLNSLFSYAFIHIQSVNRSVLGCGLCKCQVGLLYHRKAEDNYAEIHEIWQPCTRVVWGIHPSVREKIKKPGLIPLYTNGEARYFCLKCESWDLPQKMAIVVPEVSDGLRLGRVPIIDSGSKPIDGKGCWVTITEFPMNRNGRFINYQTNFDNYLKIYQEIGIG